MSIEVDLVALLLLGLLSFNGLVWLYWYFFKGGMKILMDSERHSKGETK